MDGMKRQHPDTGVTVRLVPPRPRPTRRHRVPWHLILVVVLLFAPRFCTLLQALAMTWALVRPPRRKVREQVPGAHRR